MSTSGTTPNAHSNCLVCSNVGMIIEDRVGRRCQCWHESRRRDFYNSVPREFANIRLAEARADVSRHPRQAEVLDLLRREPFRSYLFVGPNGVGKTLFCWLLVKNAFEAGQKTVTADLDSLLKQYRRYEFD